MINVVVSAKEATVPGDVADMDHSTLDAHLGSGVRDLKMKIACDQSDTGNQN